MPNSWNDINAPGFFKPETGASKNGSKAASSPISSQSGNSATELFVKKSKSEPEVKFVSAQWEPGEEGFQFTKKCNLKIKAQFLKETIRKKVSCNLFVIFKGNVEDLHHNVEADLSDDGSGIAQMTLYYGQEYYNALTENSEATCQYRARIFHPTVKDAFESELLTMPDKSAMPVLKKMAWKSLAARRGETIVLEAEFSGCAKDENVTVEIFEYDYDGKHDPVTTLKGTIKDAKLEVSWEYEYQDDVDDIVTDQEAKETGGKYHPPEYFFTVKLGNKKWGEKQESGLLIFKDWVEVELQDEAGNPLPDEPFICRFPDGNKHEGNLDKNGFARIEPVPPGPVVFEFPNYPEVTIKK